MNEDDRRVLEPDVKTAARTTAREWTEVIDAEEAEQEIWLRLTESSGSVEDLLELDQPARVNSLTRIGRQIASRYRDDYEVFSGNYVYSTDEVRKFLETGILEGATDHECNNVDDRTGEREPVGHRDCSLSGPITPKDLWQKPDAVFERLGRPDQMTVTQHVDLIGGIQTLARTGSTYFAEIINTYQYRIPASGGSEQKRRERAVDALAREMNRAHTRRTTFYAPEGPGSRKVISNDEALGLVSFD